MDSNENLEESQNAEHLIEIFSKIDSRMVKQGAP